MDVAKVNQVTIPNQPDTGHVMYRIGSYNSKGEEIRYDAGVWYWLDIPKPPKEPVGTGIE